MKKVEKKVKEVKKEIVHVYYVTDVSFWHLIIIRYQLVKKTEKHAIVLDATAKKIRIILDDRDGKVCDTHVEAKAYAKELFKAKKKIIKEYAERMFLGRAEIKANTIRDVVPNAVTISTKNIKL